MDQIKITIIYQTEEQATSYDHGTEIADTKVRVAPISDEDKARLAARIVSDAHKTIVAQQSDGSMTLRDTLLRTLERARVDAQLATVKAGPDPERDPEHDPDIAAGPRDGTSDESVDQAAPEDAKLPVEA